MKETRTIIERLRADNGCPWDRKQTPATMVRFLIEEAYELQEAIHGGDDSEISDELGDTWFQMVFLIHLIEEGRGLSFDDVMSSNCKKMIRRHPHVYGDESADTVDDVNKTWEKVKRQEKKANPASLLDTVTSGMPPITRARDVSKVTAKAGFDWDDMPSVMDKVGEEWGEFMEAMTSGDKEASSMEFGDLLFTLVNVARVAGIDPDTALSSSVAKFEKRYRHMEAQLKEKGMPVDRAVAAEQVDAAWDEAKKAVDAK